MSRRKSFFESRNPVMNEKAFHNASQSMDQTISRGETMTVQGAINKTFILSAIMLATAVFGYASPNPLFMWGGAIGGLIIVLIASFKPNLSPTLAPIYAGLEGLFVGSISAIYASMFNGIVFQAVSLTMAVLFIMLFIYKTGIIKVTEKFRAGVVMATGAIVVVYLVSFVLSFFGISVPYLHQAGPIGIGISLVIIGVAALNLLLDFDNFEKGEKYGVPSYMEWFSAMGLLITLVWLYIEILRLIAMFSSSD
jgi:uncharacterized YccA/Bax inhibitor family protein